MCLRGKADRIKIVWWDGSGLFLYAKRLEKVQFCWQLSATAGPTSPCAALALVDGMDWTRVRFTPVKRPKMMGNPLRRSESGG
ncbi:IS66 family insertion sequence element accessory protein TnpB [Pararhizobium sp. DWP1-1-3]|uniref:IS66 family insertion sequence element accessory protein TnpB n=1 Tax=Pararhizobium sp. DWP1-1-3 TaxID=2804652 RepID=UPI003CE9B6EE